MFINTKYINKQYDIKRIDDKIRYYQVNIDNKTYKFPSMTTVLSRIKNSKKLYELQQKLGDKVWKYVSDRGASRGTVMHKYLELFLFKFSITNRDLNESLKYTQINTPIDDETIEIYRNKNKFFVLGRNLFYNFWNNNWFKTINEIVFLEMKLFSLKYNFAGTADYGYINIKNQFIIGDFKSSTRKKTEDDIEKYKMQISGYMQAFYEMYNIQPYYGEIKISYDNEVDTFIVKFEDRFEYINDKFKEKSNILYQQFNKLLN